VKTRQETYECLTQKFRPVSEKLDEYGKTDLDGILWGLAQEIELDISEASRPNFHVGGSLGIAGTCIPVAFELYPVDC
jgi:hypothetical protein